jgi:hypothetical protein
MWALPLAISQPQLTQPPGYYRLWVNGIHHGDISLNNLMYSISATGKPEGVLNDYDLASWDEFPTMNSDRTGTGPFVALNMLSEALEKRIPRLYRHDAESFTWVLTYGTLASLQYNNRSLKIARPPDLDPWFNRNHRVHLQSRLALPDTYGRRIPVTEPHQRYFRTIKNLIGYWVALDDTFPDSRSIEEAEPEIDDPKGALESLIEGMEAAFGTNVEDE